MTDRTRMKNQKNASNQTISCRSANVFNVHHEAWHTQLTLFANQSVLDTIDSSLRRKFFQSNKCYLYTSIFVRYLNSFPTRCDICTAIATSELLLRCFINLIVAANNGISFGGQCCCFFIIEGIMNDGLYLDSSYGD